MALRIARESIVLLKDENNALPLILKRNVKTILVMGPNSANYPTGGGSAHVEPFHYVSVVDGLRKLAGSKAKIDSIPGPGPELLATLAAQSRYTGPLKLEFLAGEWDDRRVVATQTATAIEENWGENPAPGIDLATFTARWTGTIRAPASGDYLFMVQSHGNINVKLDGRDIIGSWSNPNDALYAYVTLEAGKTYTVEVQAQHDGGTAAVRFGWGPAPGAPHRRRGQAGAGSRRRRRLRGLQPDARGRGVRPRL